MHGTINAPEPRTPKRRQPIQFPEKLLAAKRGFSSAFLKLQKLQTNHSTQRTWGSRPSNRERVRVLQKEQTGKKSSGGRRENHTIQKLLKHNPIEICPQTPSISSPKHRYHPHGNHSGSDGLSLPCLLGGQFYHPLPPPKSYWAAFTYSAKPLRGKAILPSLGSFPSFYTHWRPCSLPLYSDRVKCVDTAPDSVDTSPRFQKT
ncbi:hypothetical protein Taro_047467 [Colocasia esculenta]|uniref:Uncharacterized protein n=1 Tax=Colocasia esculenta TaxID=4460 RepID=A0A843X760_COLES|nr:hypothetical protein [Colocasia esculenta]